MDVQLHFNDYRVYSKIFSLNGDFTKDPQFYSCFGVDTSTCALLDPDKARLSKDVLSFYFSRRAILSIADTIHNKVAICPRVIRLIPNVGFIKVNKLVHLLASRKKPTDMFYALRCTTMDIITSYAFDSPNSYLDCPEFSSPLLRDIHTAIKLIWVVKSFPWILHVIPYLPRFLGRGLHTQCEAFSRVQCFVSQQIVFVEATLPACKNSTRTVSPSIYSDPSFCAKAIPLPAQSFCTRACPSSRQRVTQLRMPGWSASFTF